MRILMLASDAHGGFGGIAQYNRDVIDAISSLAKVDEIVVLPRVIHDQSLQPPVKVRYVRAASKGKPYFIAHSLMEGAIRGGYDLVYCAHINLMPLAATISRMQRLPVALAIYGTDAWHRPSNGLTARYLGCADLLLSISRITLDRFLDWNPAWKAATAIVPNAIRVEEYGRAEKDLELVERYALAGRTVIMTLGRMAPQERKGFDEVIEMMPRLIEKRPDIVYLCVGDGADRLRLEAKARSLGVADAVVFTGRIAEERKSDHFRLADSYVMPSRGEGFGFVVLEALACGIPVVVSSADGTREAVGHGEFGLLVDPNDSGALERAVLESLSRPKGIPPGLDYFSFANFEKRLHAALSRLIAV